MCGTGSGGDNKSTAASYASHELLPKHLEAYFQACNITDRDQLRNHKSRISISRKSRTHFPRLLGHVWAGSLMYITGSYGTMAMLHALMVFHEAKCSGCGASSPLGTLMTRMLAGPRHNALRLYLGRDTSGPARISQNVGREDEQP